MTRTITAMFNTTAEAEKAGQMLVSELGIDRSSVRTSPGATAPDTGYDATRPYEEKGLFASLKNMFLPDEDRYIYAEGMRRGSALLTATVDEGQVARASDMLEHAGAADLDEQEAAWRKSGWKGYDAEAHTAYTAKTPAMAAPAPVIAPAAQASAAPQDETIKVVQERLLVGKRAVEAGRVKVRSYVVERPVEETVHLHEETVHVDRHAVDRPASAADLAAAFQDRTIEATAMSEQAVVSKEARVVEEISVHKDATDRAETVHDTVRETKVEVEDAAAGLRAVGKPSVTGGATGPGVAASIDRKLDTNLSGTNPSRT